MMAEIFAQHEACLSAHKNEKSNPNSAAEVGKCSYAACGSLHDLLFRRDWAKYRKDSEKWCDARVADYEHAVENAQKQQQALERKKRIARLEAIGRARAAEDARRSSEERVQRQADEAAKESLQQQIDSMKDAEQSHADAVPFVEKLVDVAADVNPFIAYGKDTVEGLKGVHDKARDFAGALINPMMKCLDDPSNCPTEEEEEEYERNLTQARAGLTRQAAETSMKLNPDTRLATELLRIDHPDAVAKMEHIIEAGKVMKQADQFAHFKIRSDGTAIDANTGDRYSMGSNGHIVVEKPLNVIDVWGARFAIHKDGSIVEIHSGDVYYVDSNGKIKKK